LALPDFTKPSASRSKNMAAIRSKDTKPEMTVRRALHAAGYRFRLHRKDLPGRPDIVLPKFRTVVDVRGCFWHGHDCPRGRRVPKSNVAYWVEKIRRNRLRDAVNHERLERMGWNHSVIWECKCEAGIEELLNHLCARSSVLLLPHQTSSEASSTEVSPPSAS
jgi:DNA mismatch endonuclease (patch repair protein)